MKFVSTADTRRESPGTRISPPKQPPRRLVVVGLILATMMFEISVSMPSPITSRSDDQHDGSVRPRSKRRWLLPSELNVDRQRNTARDRIPNDNIVFPDQDPSLLPRTFIPGPDPTCIDTTFCEKTDFYPENYVSNLIKRQNDLKYLAVVDMIDDITERFNTDDSTPLCATSERLIYPKTAQNRDEDWLFIVNQEGFRQGIRIETCQKPDEQCSVTGEFGNGYKTVCKQKYIYRQLVAITENGTAIRDLFKLPSSCCCHVKIQFPFNRMKLKSRSNPTQNRSPAGVST